MHISQQSAECCSHRWASLLAAHTCLAADQLRALVLAQEKKEAIHFIFASTVICFLSHLKINLGFSPSKFYGVYESLEQVLRSVYLTDIEKFSKRHLSNDIYLYKCKILNPDIHR